MDAAAIDHGAPRRVASTKTHLVIMAIVLILPVLGAAAFLGYRFYCSETSRFEQQVQSVAQSIEALVEKDLAGMTSALEVLASNEQLVEGNLAAFHARAVQVAAGRFSNITLRDRESRQLVNTAHAWGEPLPARSMLQALDQEVLRTGKPAVSDYYVGLSDGKQQIAVVAPVMRDGTIVYLLSLAVEAQRFRNLLLNQPLPPGWRASVIDRKWITVARTADPNRSGEPAPAARELRPDQDVWFWRGTGFEDDTAFSALRRTEFGWIVGVGGSDTTRIAALWRTLGLVALATLGFIALAFFAAFRVARRLSRSMESLSDLARRMGEGEAVAAPALATREASDVADALANAASRLKERDDQRQASEALARRRELRLQGVLDGMAEGFALLDANFTMLDMNDEAARLDGRPRAELVGRNHWETYPGSEESEIGRLYKRALAHHEPVSLTHRYTFADGKAAWFDMRAYPTADNRLAVFFRDVTEDKLTREELAASEAQRAAVIAAAPVGIVIADRNGRIHDGNARAEEIAGHPILHSPNAKSYAEWIAFHEDGRRVESHEYPLARVLAGEERPTLECRYQRGDGARIWIRIVGAPIREADGQMAGALVAILDIDAERMAQAELRASEAQFRTTADTLPNLLFVTSPTDGNIYVNDSFRAYTGRDDSGLLGHAWADILHPDDAERGWASWNAAIASGNPFEAEYRFRRHDGAWRWHLVRALPVRRDADAVERWVGTCTDIHHRKLDEEGLQAQVSAAVAAQQAAQAQLFEAQKMETIGHLTGGIAHDFNNLLSAILSNLDLAQKRTPDHKTAQLIDGAIKGAERGAALTGRMLAFARRQDLKSETVDVPALFDGMQDLLARSLGPGVRITSDLPADLPPISVDPNQLELAILNIGVNARDAMPMGGTLIVEAQAESVSAGDPATGLVPGDYVRLRLTDSGQGMDEATLKRATDPFFTTKGVGKGTGLGLSMVQGLAAQSGGTMCIDSALGRGTTVSLWLPQSLGAVAAKVEVTAASGAAQRPHKPLTILVVDDDVLVAMGTVAMLEDLGHTALEAHSGRKALELLAEHADVQAVITDHAMPGMTGVELAREIAKARPLLPVVLATGYAELPSGEDPGLPRLAKPFRQDHLAAMLEELGLCRAETMTIPFQ